MSDHIAPICRYVSDMPGGVSSPLPLQGREERAIRTSPPNLQPDDQYQSLVPRRVADSAPGLLAEAWFLVRIWLWPWFCYLPGGHAWSEKKTAGLAAALTRVPSNRRVQRTWKAQRSRASKGNVAAAGRLRA
jgi:hypothetical protein